MKKRKGIEAQKVKPLNPTRAIGALIGEEEQNGKPKKERKERSKEQEPNPTTQERQVRRVKKKKGIKGQRTKPPTPPQAINALVRDEEQNGK